MNRQQLKPGIRVFWQDPDNGACSRYVVIKHVEFHGEIVRLQESDGAVIECFLNELSDATDD